MLSSSCDLMAWTWAPAQLSPQQAAGSVSLDRLSSHRGQGGPVEISERLLRYAAIEQRRGRPLIVYATSTRQGIPAMMAGDAVRGFIDQIDAIPDAQSVDI